MVVFPKLMLLEFLVLCFLERDQRRQTKNPTTSAIATAPPMAIPTILPTSRPWLVFGGGTALMFVLLPRGGIAGPTVNICRL